MVQGQWTQARPVDPNRAGIPRLAHIFPEGGVGTDPQLGHVELGAVVAAGKGMPFLPSGSGTLQRILGSRQLNVGIDENRSDESAAFITGLMEFLAEQWRVSLDVSYLSASKARAALETATLHLFVSPDALAGSDYVPMFGDENGVHWSMSTQPDFRLQASLLACLRSALDYGEYRERYLASFGRLPSYEVVYSLAFPDPDVEAEEAQPWRRQTSPDAVDDRLPTPLPTPTGPPDPTPSTLRVTDVALSGDPSRFSGPCPTTVRFAGSTTVEGSGERRALPLSRRGRKHLRSSKAGVQR